MCGDPVWTSALLGRRWRVPFSPSQSLGFAFCYLILISQDWVLELSKRFHIKSSDNVGFLRAHFRMRVTSNSLIFQKHSKRCVGQTLVNRKPLHKLGGLIDFLALLLFCECFCNNPHSMSIDMKCLQRLPFLCPPVPLVSWFYPSFLSQCLSHVSFFFSPLESRSL